MNNIMLMIVAIPLAFVVRYAILRLWQVEEDIRKDIIVMLLGVILAVMYGSFFVTSKLDAIAEKYQVEAVESKESQ